MRIHSESLFDWFRLVYFKGCLKGRNNSLDAQGVVEVLDWPGKFRRRLCRSNRRIPNEEKMHES